jgi:hypothetical protein
MKKVIKSGWKLINLTLKAPLEMQDYQLGLFAECQPGGCSDIS